MYNHDALTQALQTGVTAEKALLDSLRGPDAAHRIADEQIRNIITLPAFKPRYRRYVDPESIYVGDDVNTRLFFYPYNYGTITVSLTCQAKFLYGEGGIFQQAWLSVSDGENVSSRPLSEEAFLRAIAQEHFYYDERATPSCDDYWDSEVADYMLQHNNTKGTEVEFTCDGNIKSYPPTLEQVNRAIQFFSEGELPPFSNVEYETRMKELSEEKYDYTSTLYDNLRFILPCEDGDTFYSDTYKEIRKLMRIEPKDSPLLVAANAVVERHVSNRVKFLLEVRQEDNRAVNALATEQTADTPILREALQAVLDWDATKDEQLRKLERGGRSISENVALLSGKAFTSKLYTNIGGIVETETVSASFATEWRHSEQARKEGTGLYDKDGAPLFLNVPVAVMYRSVREAMGEGFKQARMDYVRQNFDDLKHEMMEVNPKYWRAATGRTGRESEEAERHLKRVVSASLDEINYDVLHDHHVPHRFFFEYIEGCLRAWDDSIKLPYEVRYRSSISADDIQAARQSGDALPVISGERRVHLNEVRATCVRELGEFYRMVGTDPRLKGSDMLTIGQIPELVQQVGKVRDAVDEFITTAEGYWPAYTQIDGAPAESAEGELFGVEPLAEWERELLGDPVDPRREVASIIAKVSAVHPGRYTYEKRRAEDANELVASPKPSKWAFEEVLSWLRDYVEPGYPVIFKGDAEIYIVENMVAYLQRPEDETGIYGLQEDELADGTSILTCTSEDEAMKVTVDHNLGCIALSFSRYTRRGNTWESSWHEKDKEQAFEWFVADVAASKEPVQYFVAGSDNRTRKSLVDGRELLATSLTPADILYIARQRSVAMPEMVVEKALPGQRGLLVRTNITK